TDTFTYTITDGNGGTDTATVTVTVTPVDDVTTVVDDSATTDEDVAVNIDVIANDTDVDVKSPVASVTQGANGTVTIETDGTLTYTPDLNFNGEDSFTYTNEEGNTGTVTVTVTPVDDVTTVVDDSATTDEDVAVNIDVIANDTDVDVKSPVASVTQGANGTVTIETDGTLTYTPDLNFNGEDSFTYTNEEGNTGTVTVTVTPINDAPVAVDDVATTDEDNSVTISVLNNDTDVDGDDLTVVSTTNPDNGSVVINEDGTITYTPNENFNGTDSITYTITDGNGGTDTATVTITVNPINDAPVAVDDVASTDEDNSVTISVLNNDTDVDGDDLTVVSTTNPDNGSVVINEDGTITYTPNENFNGTDSITYTITDGNGGTDTATVTITVNQVDDQPDPPVVAEVVQPTCANPTGTITVQTEEGLTYSINGTDYQESGVFIDLEPGTYSVTAQNGSGEISDVVQITLAEPAAETIQTTTKDLCIEDDPFDLFELLIGDNDESGTWEDTDQTGALSGSFIDPELMAVGTYTFNYILGGSCPSTTSVQVSINDLCVVEAEACDIEGIKSGVSKAVTPNGDGHNDFFEINVDPLCGFTFGVQIFNRWGSEIYSNPNYRNEWDGFSNKSFTGSNQLPSGTYFYILTVNNGAIEPIQGYIYLGTK
ncbi:Ig-like domain-containing protein, partial [Gillisia sp. Q332]|uniref:Ig-like domain-containing protein n=1 Tax=Gillisia xinjiangensis TaxID=3384765 RepID=UPI00391CEA03